MAASGDIRVPLWSEIIALTVILECAVRRQAENSGNFNGFDVNPDGSRLVVSTLTSEKFEVWALERESWAR